MTCPLSTRGGTRLVRLVRGRGGGGEGGASFMQCTLCTITSSCRASSCAARKTDIRYVPKVTFNMFRDNRHHREYACALATVAKRAE